MRAWRDVLGFSPEEPLIFNQAHQRYRQLVVRLAVHGSLEAPRALVEAIEEARLELVPPNDDDYELRSACVVHFRLPTALGSQHEGP